jgi:hypothetical protein
VALQASKAAQTKRFAHGGARLNKLQRALLRDGEPLHHQQHLNPARVELRHPGYVERELSVGTGARRQQLLLHTLGGINGHLADRAQPPITTL